MVDPVSDEALVSAARAAAKSARRAGAMTLLAVFVAVLVLALDNGIKRAILDETARARAILDEFKTLALGALNGQAGQAAADRGAAGHGGHALVHPAGSPPAVDHDENHAGDAAGTVAGGAAAGAGGDE
jgi:hypothetical protein